MPNDMLKVLRYTLSTNNVNQYVVTTAAQCLHVGNVSNGMEKVKCLTHFSFKIAFEINEIFKDLSVSFLDIFIKYCY